MANYTSPQWANDQDPKLNATNMQAITDTLEKSQILEGSGAPGASTEGAVGQLYRDVSSTPYTLYKCTAVSNGSYTWETEVTRAEMGEMGTISYLLTDEVPNTVQTYTFSGGSVTQVLHSRDGSAVRTDTFAYGDGTITEVRTLASGASLTITTNLTTLETTVVYSAA